MHEIQSEVPSLLRMQYPASANCLESENAILSLPARARRISRVIRLTSGDVIATEFLLNFAQGQPKMRQVPGCLIASLRHSFRGF
jgi:hypothetical protein